MDPKFLRLTPVDDIIYRTFREEFPKFDVKLLIEDDLKCADSKAKWRPFCEKFKYLVEDYSYGTLLRADASKNYTEENSILVIRMQFFAIELARNREGVNNFVQYNYKVSK